MIRLWNDKALAQELKAGLVTEHQTVIYLLINVLAYEALGLQWWDMPQTEVTGLVIASNLANLLAVAWGVFYCFKKNNVDFVRRITCLMLPINLRAIVFFIPLVIVYITAFVLIGSNEENPLDESFIDERIQLAGEYLGFTAILFVVWVYLRIGKRLKEIS